MTSAPIKPSSLSRQFWKYNSYLTADRFILAVRFILVVLNYLIIFCSWQSDKLEHFYLFISGSILIYGLLCFAGSSLINIRALHFILTLSDFVIVSAGFYYLPPYIADGTYFIYFVGIVINILYGGYLSSLGLSLLASVGLGMAVWPSLKAEKTLYLYSRLLNLNLVTLAICFLGLKIREIIKSVESEKEESKKQYHQLQVLSRIAKEINGELEIDKLLFLIIKKADELTKSQAGGIILKDSDEIYRIKATNGMAKTFLEKEIALGVGLPGRVLTERKTVCDRNPSFDPNGEAACDLDHYRFAIAAPIWWKGDILGLLFLLRGRQANSFTKDDKLLLETLSEHAAIAVSNARLFKMTASLSLNDYLTGVGNLRFFYQQLEHTFAVAERYQQPFSLMAVDSDSLKQINDQYGTAQGFKHIKQLAGILKNTIRGSDLIARYDRDMFMIILPHTDVAETLKLAERIRSLVNESPIIINGQPVHTTVCIGLASYPGHAGSMQALVSAVESALYRAKRLGQNQLLVAEEHNER
ncbi:MAG: diguanylate cyclase [Bacillota bacterium]